MGQNLSRDQIKLEIENNLGICFLSLHQNDLNNLSTACVSKGSVESFFKLLSKKKENSYIDEYFQSKDNSVLLNTIVQQPIPSSIQTRKESIAKESKTTTTNKLETKGDKKEDGDENTLIKSINNCKYEVGSIESIYYQGDEIYVQVIQSGDNGGGKNQLTFKIFERVLSPTNSLHQQYKPQPNEYLTSWEYFDELNSSPIFYDINPLYNMINSDSYTIQERVITDNRDFIKFLLQSLSTYLSPLPNSIHFNDSSIPTSIDYSQSNQLKLHPNILPIIEIISTKTELETESLFLLQKSFKYSLGVILRYSSIFLQKNPKNTNFILYQLVQIISFLHDKEIPHGNLTPSSIYLNEQMWLGLNDISFNSSGNKLLQYHQNDNDIENLVVKWVNGEISNFKYLMFLNKLAHRRVGDHLNHPVLPWVIDFSKHPSSGLSSWRDLTKTKYRLNKGDEQLDFQYQNIPMLGGSQKAHHISDILSELTYYSYLARRTPVPLLRRFVRTNYEPNEYPSTMERLYRWTPDECIPEFFTDPSIFKSIHNDMPDLQIPDWAQSAEEFIQIHMNSLESDHVSKQLHSWIDLTFGYLLTGEEAIKVKNLALMDTSVPRNSGIVQLFTTPHPRKNIKSQVINQQNQSNSNQFDDYIKFNDSWENISNNQQQQQQQNTNNQINSSSNSIFNITSSLGLTNTQNNTQNSLNMTTSLINPIVVNSNNNSNNNNNMSNSINSIMNTPNQKDSYNNGPSTPSTPYQAKTVSKSSSSTFSKPSNTSNTSGSSGSGSSSTKKEESSKSFSKFLPSIIQQSISTLTNNLKDDSYHNNNNNNGFEPTSNKSSNNGMIQSKSDESIKRQGIFSSNGGIGSNRDLFGVTSPPSPSSSSSNSNEFQPIQPIQQFSPQQQSQTTSGNSSSGGNRPVTPPIGNSGDLPITQIIEPFSSYIEFDVDYDSRLDYSNPMNNSNGQPLNPNSSTNTVPTGATTTNTSGLNYDIFMDSLYKCESLSNFNNSFKKLIPIYKPMEYIRSTKKQQQQPNLLSFIEEKQLSNLELLKSNDLFALGCIIGELYQGYPLFTSTSLINHFDQNNVDSGNNKNSYSVTYNLPKTIKEIVDRLILPNPEERIKPKEILANTNIFPSYFKQMYHFLCHHHSIYTPEERLTFTLANIGIITSLPNESMDIILPFIMELFEHPSTMVSALIDLLDPLSQRLGAALSKSYLLPSVIKLYQKHDDHLLQCHLIQIPLIDMIVTRFGRDTFVHHILPFLIDSVKTNPRENPNHDMLTMALIMISKVLGVPLTIRHIMYPLLVALTKPHLSHLNEALVAIASSLGEYIIIKFYFPAIFTLIQKHSSKATRSESIPCTLLSLLQELILLVKPGLVLRSLLMESTQLAALLLNPSNPALLLPLAETLLRISGRIGVDNTKKYILKYLQQFFSNYSDLYNYSGDSSYALIDTSENNKQLRTIYSPEMTYHLYYKLARIIGFEIMRVEILDNPLIEHIMMIYIRENNIKDPLPTSSIPPYVSDDGINEDCEELLDHKISYTYSLDDYQDFDDLIVDQTFSLQGNIVSFYKEHTASIRSIAMSSTESIFATGSKDNLVKIWSLDSNRSLTTYNSHIHTTHSIHFMSNLVASCDITSIQVWDPESKVKVNVFYEPNGGITCFEPLNNKHILASSGESSISFYDLNMGQETHQWVLSYSATSQQIRSITTSNDQFSQNSSTSSHPTWIAAGSSTGTIYILDSRTGTILDQWKTHDGPVLKLIGQGTRYLISCSEKSIIQWDLSTSPPTVSKMWKGFKESVSSVALYQNDLFASYGQRISTMSLQDDGFSQTGYNTFRVDGIKLNTQKQSNINSLSFLPLHHLLLAGTEDGYIKILH